MTTYLKAAFLGLVQGLSEFLPISSSGHLAILEHYIEFEVNNLLAFDIAVHFGTLVAILFLFKSTWINMLKGKEKGLMLWIMISMIPAGIIGTTIGDELVMQFRKPHLIASAFLFLACIYVSLRWFKTHRKPGTYASAILMGLGQALAILPGISRSGMTISLAKMYGISFHNAAKYSFMMVAPVILGAQLLSINDLIQTGTLYQQIDLMLIGAFTACISSFFTAKFMLDWCKKHGLSVFSYYLIALSLLIFYLQS